MFTWNGQKTAKGATAEPKITVVRKCPRNNINAEKKENNNNNMKTKTVSVNILVNKN